MEPSFLSNMIYSMGSAAVVGFIFWAFLSAKFNNITSLIESNKSLAENKIDNNKTLIDELRRRVVQLEQEKSYYLTRSDFKEEKRALIEEFNKVENKLELKIDRLDLKIETMHNAMIDMPGTIVKLIEEKN